jgi:hypothetical protein
MRPTGVQQIVLSSGFGRQFGTVYGGDADISHAHALMKFLSEHFESRKTGALDPSSRNNCAEPEAN